MLVAWRVLVLVQIRALIGFDIDSYFMVYHNPHKN